jgi:transcriptional regulator with XRE-family HTH domain
MKPILTPDLVRAARGLVGWSQIELATKAGVTVRTISRLESSTEPASSKVSTLLHDAFAGDNVRFVARYTESGELESFGVLKIVLPKIDS